MVNVWGGERLGGERLTIVVFTRQKNDVALAYGGNTTLNKDLVIDIFSLL